MVQSSPAASYLSTHQHFHNCNSECVISLITRSSRKTGLSFINCIIWGFLELTAGRISYFELSGAWLCPSARLGQPNDTDLRQALGCGYRATFTLRWGIWEAQLSEPCYEPGTLHMLYLFFILFNLIRGRYHKYSHFTGDNMKSPRGWVSKGHTASSWDSNASVRSISLPVKQLSSITWHSWRHQCISFFFLQNAFISVILADPQHQQKRSLLTTKRRLRG